MSAWLWPNGGPLPPQVPGSMSSTDEYGWRTWTQPARMHWGIDLYINDYWNRAASDGVVTFRGYNGGAGNEVVLAHVDGSQTRYKHNAYFAAGTDVGSTVSAGQVIGRMGTTGDSTGDHLHFEVRDNPALNAVEPRAFMAARTALGQDGSATPNGRRPMSAVVLVKPGQPAAGKVYLFQPGRVQHLTNYAQANAITQAEGGRIMNVDLDAPGDQPGLADYIVAYVGPGVSLDSVIALNGGVIKAL